MESSLRGRSWWAGWQTFIPSSAPYDNGHQAFACWCMRPAGIWVKGWDQRGSVLFFPPLTPVTGDKCRSRADNLSSICCLSRKENDSNAQPLLKSLLSVLLHTYWTHAALSPRSCEKKKSCCFLTFKWIISPLKAAFGNLRNKRNECSVSWLMTVWWCYNVFYVRQKEP